MPGPELQRELTLPEKGRRYLRQPEFSGLDPQSKVHAMRRFMSQQHREFGELDSDAQTRVATQFITENEPGMGEAIGGVLPVVGPAIEAKVRFETGEEQRPWTKALNSALGGGEIDTAGEAMRAAAGRDIIENLVGIGGVNILAGPLFKRAAAKVVPRAFETVAGKYGAKAAVEAAGGQTLKETGKEAARRVITRQVVRYGAEDLTAGTLLGASHMLERAQAGEEQDPVQDLLVTPVGSLLLGGIFMGIGGLKNRFGLKTAQQFMEARNGVDQDMMLDLDDQAGQVVQGIMRSTGLKEEAAADLAFRAAQGPLPDPKEADQVLKALKRYPKMMRSDLGLHILAIHRDRALVPNLILDETKDTLGVKADTMRPFSIKRGDEVVNFERGDTIDLEFTPKELERLQPLIANGTMLVDRAHGKRDLMLRLGLVKDQAPIDWDTLRNVLNQQAQVPPDFWGAPPQQLAGQPFIVPQQPAGPPRPPLPGPFVGPSQPGTIGRFGVPPAPVMRPLQQAVPGRDVPVRTTNNPYATGGDQAVERAYGALPEFEGPTRANFENDLPENARADFDSPPEIPEPLQPSPNPYSTVEDDLVEFDGPPGPQFHVFRQIERETARSDEVLNLEANVSTLPLNPEDRIMMEVDSSDYRIAADEVAKEIEESHYIAPDADLPPAAGPSELINVTQADIDRMVMHKLGIELDPTGTRPLSPAEVAAALEDPSLAYPRDEPSLVRSSTEIAEHTHPVEVAARERVKKKIKEGKFGKAGRMYSRAEPFSVPPPVRAPGLVNAPSGIPGFFEPVMGPPLPERIARQRQPKAMTEGLEVTEPLPIHLRAKQANPPETPMGPPVGRMNRPIGDSPRFEVDTSAKLRADEMAGRRPLGYHSLPTRLEPGGPAPEPWKPKRLSDTEGRISSDLRNYIANNHPNGLKRGDRIEFEGLKNRPAYVVMSPNEDPFGGVVVSFGSAHPDEILIRATLKNGKLVIPKELMDAIQSAPDPGHVQRMRYIKAERLRMRAERGIPVSDYLKKYGGAKKRFGYVQEYDDYGVPTNRRIHPEAPSIVRQSKFEYEVGGRSGRSRLNRPASLEFASPLWAEGIEGELVEFNFKAYDNTLSAAQRAGTAPVNSPPGAIFEMTTKGDQWVFMRELHPDENGAKRPFAVDRATMDRMVDTDQARYLTLTKDKYSFQGQPVDKVTIDELLLTANKLTKLAYSMKKGQKQNDYLMAAAQYYNWAGKRVDTINKESFGVNTVPRTATGLSDDAIEMVKVKRDEMGKIPEEDLTTTPSSIGIKGCPPGKGRKKKGL